MSLTFFFTPHPRLLYSVTNLGKIVKTNPADTMLSKLFAFGTILTQAFNLVCLSYAFPRSDTGKGIFLAHDPKQSLSFDYHNPQHETPKFEFQPQFHGITNSRSLPFDVHYYYFDLRLNISVTHPTALDRAPLPPDPSPPPPLSATPNGGTKLETSQFYSIYRVYTFISAFTTLHKMLTNILDSLISRFFARFPVKSVASASEYCSN